MSDAKMRIIVTGSARAVGGCMDSATWQSEAASIRADLIGLVSALVLSYLHTGRYEDADSLAPHLPDLHVADDQIVLTQGPKAYRMWAELLLSCDPMGSA